jgi:hypothetical protein
MLHLVAIVLSVVLFVAGYSFLFRSLDEHFQMQHEINAKLPPAGKFEPMFWGIGTRKRFRQLQKELLPDSHRLQKFHRFQVTSFALGMLFLVFALRR